MKPFRSLALLAVLGVAAPALFLSVVHAEPATKPARKTPKLTKPYADIASLTDEQKFKLDEIHDTATKEIRKIREKEEEDSLAVLTPEQRAEMKSAEEDAAAKRKEKQAKKDK